MLRLPARFAWLPLCCVLGLASPLVGQDEAKPTEAPQPAGVLYDLKYKFMPGETLRWNVEHKAKIRTTVSGTTQTAETDTFSVKVWKVQAVGAKTGNVEFEHSVESVRMVQRLTGRKEETYDSTVDKVAPPAFQDAAKNVGVPLSIIRMDARGKVGDRKDRTPQAKNDTQITIPLPSDPVAIGHEWSVPHEVEVGLTGGQVKKIQCRQQYKLESVKNGVAAITVATIILTPVRDPAIEVQLIQRESAGIVKFDIERGRIVGQQMDLDKQVYGFSGDTSSMHYQTRFIETLAGTEPSVAKIGPALPPKKGAPKLQR